MNELCSLLRRLGIQRKYIFLLMFRAPFDGLRGWMLASLMRTTFYCIEVGAADRLLTECIFYGLICGILFLYNGSVWSIYAALCAKTEAMLQKTLLSKLMYLSAEQMDRYSKGEWITRLNSDVHAAIILMNGPLNIPHAVVSILNMVLSSFLLGRSSFDMLVIAWAFIIPHLFIHYKVTLKYIPYLKEKSQKAMAESTSAITPLITESETILLYDAGDLLMKNGKESSRRLMRINMNMHVRNAISSVALRWFGICGYITMMLVGYNTIYNGALTFSDIVYSFQLRGSVLAAASLFITCISNVEANLVCVKRMNDMLEI